jgi:hypothetical protein
MHLERIRRSAWSLLMRTEISEAGRRITLERRLNRRKVAWAKDYQQAEPLLYIVGLLLSVSSLALICSECRDFRWNAENVVSLSPAICDTLSHSLATTMSAKVIFRNNEN